MRATMTRYIKHTVIKFHTFLAQVTTKISWRIRNTHMIAIPTSQTRFQLICACSDALGSIWTWLEVTACDTVRIGIACSGLATGVMRNDNSIINAWSGRKPWALDKYSRGAMDNTGACRRMQWVRQGTEEDRLPLGCHPTQPTVNLVILYC